MKYLFILLFAAFGLSTSAQDKATLVNQLVEQELKMIQKDLSNQNSSQELSAEQTTKLKKLLIVKSEKINAVRQSDQSKLKMSQNLNAITKEFEPAILEIFNSDQKEAFKASPRNKKRFTRKN